MSPPLSIATVNYNSSDFLELLVQACEALTAREFEFLVMDNGSNWRHKRRLRALADGRDHVEVFWREQEASGSEAHGTALNLLAEKMTGDYGVFMDADATFLHANWDDHLIGLLDETTKAAGTPPVPNPKKPTDFPSLYAILFDLDVFHDLDVDMRPADPSVGKDTGWEMREKFFDAGYDAVNLDVRNTRDYADGPFGDILCAEYYLDGVDDIFACHFGRGSSLGAAKYFKWLPLVPVLGTIPKKLAGYREKREWIDRCHDIIDAQPPADAPTPGGRTHAASQSSR